MKIKLFTLIDTETFLDRPCYHFIIPQQELVDIKDKKYFKNEKINIVHAPSDRQIKGTEIVIKVIDKLKKKYSINFNLIEGRPNQDVLTILKDSDIAIDQPGLWPGKFAAEALASGCVVIGGNQIPEKFAIKGNPIIQFHNDEKKLYDSLESLILSKNIHDLGKKGFTWLKENYHKDIYCKKIYEAFNNETPFDLFPIPNIKKKLIQYSENLFHRLLIIFLIEHEKND